MKKSTTSNKIERLGFDEPVYKVSLVLLVGGTSDDAHKEIGKLGCTYDFSEHEKCRAFYFKCNPEDHGRDYEFSVIWIKNRKDTTSLVHEIIHLVFQNFEDKKVPIRWENDEPFAYYVEYWFRRITETLRNHKK